MILVDIKWNSGLYDFDTTSNVLSRVLKVYKGNEFSFKRFEYRYVPENYREATEKDINEHGAGYFDDSGEQVLLREVMQKGGEEN